jgi:GTPase SAR1 family protein
MTQTINTQKFINNLELVAQIRANSANYIAQIANAIALEETEGEQRSGKLVLDREIQDLLKISQEIKQGTFRLMILGDMKRGKSTFLNALLGEKLLPSDVNPCTAIMTVLRYGEEKKVKLYFNNGRSPEEIDFETFKRRYTIDPSEAKRLEKEKQLVPTIDYAVVEYPLPLLERGIEIIDSPGLNDTEARNEISLNYINNCHAILFVLSATQPCTLVERRYLENYIKNRGLTVFFLINAWDRIRDSLLDPDDLKAVREAEEKVRKVFRANLSDYCYVNNNNLYEERVFEICSLTALRRRLKNSYASLEKTGFTEFITSLDRFLIQESAVSQLQQAKTLAEQSYDRVKETIERRILLLDRNEKELKEKILSVEPEFVKLADICDRFIEEIREIRNQKAKAIADSFQTYFLNLDKTFQEDFLPYQPDLGMLDIIDISKRQLFEAALKQGFEHYLNDRMAVWSLELEKNMNDAFSKLAEKAESYGENYRKVTDQITQKLLDEPFNNKEHSTGDRYNSSAWANWAKELISFSPDRLNNTALDSSFFNWKSLLVNLISVVAIRTICASLLGFILNPALLIFLSVGIGTFQIELARQEILKTIQKELFKHLPQIIQEQWQPIHDAVKNCFNAYEKEITERVRDDIYARKTELQNLLKQKQTYKIDREQEIERLRAIDANILASLHKLDETYNKLFNLS